MNCIVRKNTTKQSNLGCEGRSREIRVCPPACGCVLVLGICAAPVTAQPFSTAWLQQLGTAQMDDVVALAPDGNGGTYVFGFTFGSLHSANAGSADVHLSRWSSTGAIVWGQQFGTSAADSGFAAASDGAGGVFVAGRTGGNLLATSAGGNDAFAAHYGPAGEIHWTRQFGTSASDGIFGIAGDGAGGAFATGSTQGSLAGQNAGSADIHVERLEDNGDPVWIRQFGTVQFDSAQSLAVSGDGVFIAGWTFGSMNGPNLGAEDALLARFDREGVQSWARQYGTPGQDVFAAVAPDDSGGVFAVGTCWGLLGGASFGDIDAVILRVDSGGNTLWIRQFGTADADSLLGVTSDDAGGVWVAGATGGVSGGSGAESDVMLGRFDGKGAMSWLHQFGSPLFDQARPVIRDGQGGLIVGGRTDGTLGVSSAGLSDGFLGRLVPCYADCSGDGLLTVQDFGCFQTKFVAGDPYADCNADGSLSVADFGCFQTRFVSGCS